MGMAKMMCVSADAVPGGVDGAAGQPVDHQMV
jgi:hypothetical protein